MAYRFQPFDENGHYDYAKLREIKKYWLEEDFAPILDKKLVQTSDGDYYKYLFTPRRPTRHGPSSARLSINVPAADINFVHEPLASPATQIRLLHLLPGNPQDVLRCELSTHDFDSCPAYNCLSYVWGSPRGTEPMLLDNGVIGVTPNLMMALFHIRKQSKERVVLWVDAICIDQSNDAEKSLQVQMMTEIYRKAQILISWLGPAQERGRGLMKQIHLLSWASLFFEFYPSLRHVYLHILRRVDWVLLRPIMDSSYWNRMWILQELVVRSFFRNFMRVYNQALGNVEGMKAGLEISRRNFGPNDYMLYGPYKILFPRILSINKVILDRGLEDDGLFSAIGKRFRATPVANVFAGPRSLGFLRQLRACFPQPKNIAAAYLNASQDLQATQPRDRLYALAGIFPSFNIVPDYGKSEEEVALDVAAIIIKSAQKIPVDTIFSMENHRLDPWISPPDPDSGIIPTWIPYGSALVPPTRIFSPFFLRQNQLQMKSKRRDDFSDAKLVCGGRKLQVKLLYQSRITQIWKSPMSKCDIYSLQTRLSARTWPLRDERLDPAKPREYRLSGHSLEAKILSPLVRTLDLYHQIALLEDGNLVNTCRYSKEYDDVVIIKGLRCCTVLRLGDHHNGVQEYTHVENAAFIGVSHDDVIGDEEIDAVLA